MEWTLETTMDVELIGTWANEAHIVVYFTHNNARGKYEAFSAALFDKIHKPTVISCSWGAPERLISRVLVEEMDLMFQAAALMGITIVCSSGDDGNGSAASRRAASLFPCLQPPRAGLWRNHPPPCARREAGCKPCGGRRVAGQNAESGYGESDPCSSAELASQRPHSARHKRGKDGSRRGGQGRCEVRL